ncbi:phage tail protein [Sphingorhabdus soli]|uniref:Phage tail protein n=2 Tax=Flavisphingopyxis soli TaxID=2601267 RepID=A0A5C6UU02_9SPHN|nr:phage tail protein [Sphingorhabdus soli]
MVAGAAPAHAQASDPFLGQLALVGFTFCPRGWADANGQLLAIASNTALFSLFGTTYGGDGRTTFALPDLRGRVPIHLGQGPGLSNYTQGQTGGVETTTMTVAQMPQHTHVASVQTAGPVMANHRRADGAAFGVTADNTYVRPGTPVASYDMAAGTVVNANAGSGQAQTNIPPYLTMRYCVATQGVFPSRN